MSTVDCARKPPDRTVRVVLRDVVFSDGIPPIRPGVTYEGARSAPPRSLTSNNIQITHTNTPPGLSAPVQPAILRGSETPHYGSAAESTPSSHHTRASVGMTVSVADKVEEVKLRIDVLQLRVLVGLQRLDKQDVRTLKVESALLSYNLGGVRI